LVFVKFVFHSFVDLEIDLQYEKKGFLRYFVILFNDDSYTRNMPKFMQIRGVVSIIDI